MRQSLTLRLSHSKSPTQTHLLYISNGLACTAADSGTAPYHGSTLRGDILYSTPRSVVIGPPPATPTALPPLSANQRPRIRARPRPFCENTGNHSAGGAREEAPRGRAAQISSQTHSGSGQRRALIGQTREDTPARPRNGRTMLL